MDYIPIISIRSHISSEIGVNKKHIIETHLAEGFIGARWAFPFRSLEDLMPILMISPR
jgi:hypothetical protein